MCQRKAATLRMNAPANDLVRDIRGETPLANPSVSENIIVHDKTLPEIAGAVL
jgi:hypothetical protein